MSLGPRRSRLRRAVAVAAAAALGVVPLAACDPVAGANATQGSGSKASASKSKSKSKSKSRSKSSTRSVVVISADRDTCWSATVNGRKRTGCGPARFTDRRGSASAATVVRTRGDSRVRVKLVVDGRTVDSGSARTSTQQISVSSDSRAG